MRQRLLTAVMTSYGQRLELGPPGVDEVIKEADVSRATFYKYFNSVDEAIHLLGGELVDEMAHSLRSLFVGSDRPPFVRLVTGIQLFLMRSVTDPLWGAFVSRTDYLARDSDLLKTMTQHLTAARKQGDLHFIEVDAAISLLVGALLEAIRHLVRSGQRSRAYVEELNIMILCGLGVAPEAAQKAVRERATFIRGMAPERLSWWRDPWQ